MNVDLFRLYALQFVGDSYRFGSNGPTDWDCSGFVLELLKASGLKPPQKDMSAQAIYNWIGTIQTPVAKTLDTGTLLFFGKDTQSINHIAMMLDPKTMIEAAGGDSTTLTLADAKAKGWAMVRCRPFGYRSDFLTFYNPGLFA